MPTKLSMILNEDAYTRACDELKIDKPTIRFVVVGGKEGVYGEFRTPLYHIDIFCPRTYETDTLRGATGEVIRTILHELRHAHQYTHQREKYFSSVVWREEDAFDYEARKVAEYRDLCKVVRKFHGSGMSRLKAAEMRSRYS